MSCLGVTSKIAAAIAAIRKPAWGRSAQYSKMEKPWVTDDSWATESTDPRVLPLDYLFWEKIYFLLFNPI